MHTTPPPNSSLFTSCNTRLGIQIWYPQMALVSKYDCGDCLMVRQMPKPLNSSKYGAYWTFPFEIKTLERGSEKYSL